MNSEAAGSGGAHGEERAADQPIGILADQERETHPDFIHRVRSKIHRRAAASHFAAYSWHLPKVVMTEMVGLLGHLVSAHFPKKESKR